MTDRLPRGVAGLPTNRYIGSTMARADLTIRFMNQSTDNKAG